MSFMFVQFMEHVDFVCSPFNARDHCDQQRDQKEYFVNGDSERDGDCDEDRRFSGMRMIKRID